MAQSSREVVVQVPMKLRGTDFLKRVILRLNKSNHNSVGCLVRWETKQSCVQTLIKTQKKETPLCGLFSLRQKYQGGLLGINQDFNNSWVYADSAAHPLQVEIIPKFAPLCPKTAVKTNYKPIYIKRHHSSFFLWKIAPQKH